MVRVHLSSRLGCYMPGTCLFKVEIRILYLHNGLLKPRTKYYFWLIFSHFLIFSINFYFYPSQMLLILNFLFQVKGRMVRRQSAVRQSLFPFNQLPLKSSDSTVNLRRGCTFDSGETKALGKVVKRKWYKPRDHLEII